MRISIGQLAEAFGLDRVGAVQIFRNLPTFLKRKYFYFDIFYNKNNDYQKGHDDIPLENDYNQLQAAADRYLEIPELQKNIALAYEIFFGKRGFEKTIWLIEELAAAVKKEREGKTWEALKEELSDDSHDDWVIKEIAKDKDPMEMKSLLEDRVAELLLNLVTVEADDAVKFITKNFGKGLVKEVTQLTRDIYEENLPFKAQKPENEEKSLVSSAPEKKPMKPRVELPELFCPTPFAEALEGEDPEATARVIRTIKANSDLMKVIKARLKAGISREKIAHDMRGLGAEVAVIGALVKDPSPSSIGAATKAGQRLLQEWKKIQSAPLDSV